MDIFKLEPHFRRIGARLRVRPETAGGVAIDVVEDRFGESFEIRFPKDTEADLFPVTVDPSDRHLLLALRDEGKTSKFLCGHDERHWFVAGLPDFANGAGTVRAAKDALKPAVVRMAEDRQRVSVARRHRRRNEAFVRQGEWFFLPQTWFRPDPVTILHNEPLSRGVGSKPHRLEESVRTGGEVVHVCSRHPLGVTTARYNGILSRNPKARTWGWSVQRRNPAVYARGRVRHPDHATIRLHEWHLVAMNTEGQSVASRFVAFLD
ncbi:MAG TPA: hypothetical protein VGJ05_17250 [Fimbriiglobus sp.]|jgi:hypothetical protein